MQEDNYNDLKGFLLLSSISVLTFTCVCNLHLQKYMTNLTLCFEGHFKKVIKVIAIWKPTLIYLLIPTLHESWLCKPTPSFMPAPEHDWVCAELFQHVMQLKNYPCFLHLILVSFPSSWHAEMALWGSQSTRTTGRGKRTVSHGQRQEEGGTTSSSAWRDSRCRDRAASFIGKTSVVPRMQFCLAIFPQGILQFFS